MRFRAPLFAAVLLVSPLLPSTAHADELFQNLVGRVNKPLLDPAGFFAVVLPAGFDCEAQPRHVRCLGNRGVQALLTIDVWEHAYYIDHRNLRPRFVETFMNSLVNWDFAQRNFA